MSEAQDDSLRTLLTDAELPNSIPCPKPGQSVDDDDCLHIWLLKATVRDMTVFALNAAPHADNAVRNLRNKLVNYARLKAKPGLTGLQQVEARATGELDERVRLDVYYIRRRSFLFDLWILIRTPWAVIHGRGAV